MEKGIYSSSAGWWDYLDVSDSHCFVFSHMVLSIFCGFLYRYVVVLLIIFWSQILCHFCCVAFGTELSEHIAIDFAVTELSYIGLCMNMYSNIQKDIASQCY